MHEFPGVPWNVWPELPYEVVLACVSFIDTQYRGDSGEE